jgi:ankyrin repeat protein
VVTEGMLTEAARAGNLGRLTVWARQGVRVTSAMPLCAAARGDHLRVLQCLVRKLGADVDQAMLHGRTPLFTAARVGRLAVVRCLIELGANVGAVDDQGCTALLRSARLGRYAISQFLLEEVGADMMSSTIVRLTV